MFTRAERIALRVSFLFLETRKGRQAGLLPAQYDALRAARDKISWYAYRDDSLKSSLTEARRALLQFGDDARNSKAETALRNVEMALAQLS